MPKIPIALHLHSVRKSLRDDPAGVLATIRAMGYDGVEFAGFHNQRPVTWRRLLAEAGLRCAGAHVPFADLLPARLEDTLIYQQALGSPYLIVSALPDEYLAGESSWLQAARVLANAADRGRVFGVRIGYRNREFEFTRRGEGGRSFWDIFFYLAGNAVCMQPDCGQAARAGVDASEIVRRYSGRCRTLHLSEWSKDKPDAIIGEGEVAWERVFEACESVGGTEWYIVNQDVCPLPPLDCAKRNLQHLRMMGR